MGTFFLLEDPFLDCLGDDFVPATRLSFLVVESFVKLGDSFFSLVMTRKETNNLIFQPL